MIGKINPERVTNIVYYRFTITCTIGDSILELKRIVAVLYFEQVSMYFLI